MVIAAGHEDDNLNCRVGNVYSYQNMAAYVTPHIFRECRLTATRDELVSFPKLLFNFIEVR